ncbi:hypothetical protein [Pseudomonas sp.]|uniref:hypothetical protein n=1 Tax=Pseudomonas sp. TaxID=306 RepID=UPI0027308101|nr:hypothetical protein [Pseudomonas sp.]MDP2244060.1 hypothetical protein [Pseudomonas sp.]
MRRTLSIRHTVDRHGKPLAELIDNLSGLCGGLYPADLRHLARTFNTAANDLEQGERGLVVYCIQE